MNWHQKLYASFLSLIQGEPNPTKLAQSFSVGLYIACSPFFGLHALMMITCKYLFNLHLPTLFFATSLNNPWTMIPVYSGGYMFGHWFLHSLIGISPTWLLSCEKIFGCGKICVWSFLIGGNILGILCAAIAYPITKTIFSAFSQRTTP